MFRFLILIVINYKEPINLLLSIFKIIKFTDKNLKTTL